jgi:KDEL-tailed cysteine endopeptidase
VRHHRMCSCRHCAAHATAAAVEGAVAINTTGILNELSVQQLMDCSTDEGGCTGGYLSEALDYTQAHGDGRIDEPGHDGNGDGGGC